MLLLPLEELSFMATGVCTGRAPWPIISRGPICAEIQKGFRSAMKCRPRPNNMLAGNG